MTPEMLAFLSSLLVKATVLLASAALAGRALRHRSASARHAVWSVALLGLLALPLLSAVLPRWELPMLPARSAAPATAPAADPAHRTAAAPIVLAGAVTRAARETAGTETFPVAPAVDAVRARHWSEWVLLLWSLGATVGLLRLAGGAWVARRIAQDATPVTDDEWTALVADVSRTLGLSRTVEILQSADVALPVVWGYRSPKVLLPPDAGEWPLARKRAFLLHELAHIERHDCLVQTLASIVHALYWPHPLVWWTMRRLRREAEHACDDRVLSAGTRGPEYADHLLDVARSLQHARSPIVVMGIVERSNLEDRLLALLDPHLRRGAVGRRAVAVGASVGFGLVATVAVLQPVARAAVAQVIAAATKATQPEPAIENETPPEETARGRDGRAAKRPAPRYQIAFEGEGQADARPAAPATAVAVEPEPMHEARLAPPSEPAPVAAAAPAAPDPAPPVVVRLGVDLVQLDAVVTDGHGRQITDLQADDFEVREDGKPQKVTHVRYVRAADPGTAPRAEDPRRVITLVVDDLGLSFPAMSHIRDGLRRLVREKVGPNDLVAVVTTGKPGGLRQRLTNDREQLGAAVDGLRYDPWNRSASGFMSAGDNLFRRMPRASDRVESSLTDNIPVGGAPPAGVRNQHLAAKTLGALEDYIVEMRGLPGRKSLLFFSDELTLRDHLASSGQPPYLDPMMQDGVQRVTDAAGRSSVVIYGVGSGGVVPTLETAAGQTDPGASVTRQLSRARSSAFTRRHSDLDGIGRLADATGGFLFYGGQHVDSALDVIMEDLRGYYLVGYTPGDQAFRPNKKGQRAYHEIEVKVARRGVKVRSRAGFYGVTDEETMPARRSELADLR